ncbi:hypothetical protein NX722_28390 [Endozoicomonas gorgoniicola]|uniref:Uncharacterized protein n=1 Tax=Endozoicomonas gorgoniicola TaxID=1234144 RepID=A0ABT3N4B9_9GAMM|nr:hypothetical protein [Endozoicomonas gorgoniicola]MCW7556486.1 hypothetical protein [Endozoicomonas gorgoniicola]
MAIVAEVGKVYRPLDVKIDGLALAENARQDITTRHGDIKTKHSDVVGKHAAVQTWHSNVAQWQQDTATYRDQANTYQQQANVARTAAESAQASAEVAKNNTILAKDAAVAANNSAQSAKTSAASSKTAAANSATQASNSATLAKNAETTASGYRDNANYHSNKALTARAGAETAESNAEAAEAKAEKWAEHPENSAVESGKYSAKHHAEKANDYKNAANTYQNNAKSYRDSANSHKNTAGSYATSAHSSATTASSKATEAGKSADKAQEWASKDQGQVVESGEYSAKHYAKVAETHAQAVTSGLKFKGKFDASSGNPPATPAADTPDYYRIIKGGTINGVAYNTGDNICWDPVSDEWFKIDNTDRAITSSLTSSDEEVSLSAKAGKNLQDNKLDKSGGDVGTLNFNTTNDVLLSYKGKDVVKALDSTGAMSFGCDNATIVGAGEAQVQLANNVSKTSEVLHLGSDNQVKVYTALQGGWAARREFNFNTDGSFSTNGPILDDAGRVYSPGNKPQWGDVGNKPASFPPSSHNHDSAYLGKTAKAADSNKLDGLDSTQFARRDYSTARVTVGGSAEWVTLAIVDGGGRASARFKLAEGEGGNHGHVEFYAAVSYGNVPCINILSVGGYLSFTGLLRRLRIIKDSSDEVYGSHKLQLLLEKTATVHLYLYEDEVPHDKWKLLNFTEKGLPSGYTEALSVDLDLNGGITTTGEFYAQGGNRVFHEGYLPNSLAGSGGRKNLLDNGRKKINQRGFDGNWSALANGEYGYDRWKKHANGIEQIIEGGYHATGDYTLSWQGSGSGYVNGAAVENGGTVTISDADANISVVVPASADAIQFERGDAATDFEYVHPRDQLARCQRYFQALISSSGICSLAMDRVTDANNTYYGYVELPVLMRVSPTVTYSLSHGIHKPHIRYEPIRSLTFSTTQLSVRCILTPSTNDASSHLIEFKEAAGGYINLSADL